MRLSLRAYRLLIKLYPARFRGDYGTPLERQFKDDYLESASAWSLIVLWLRTLLDLARSLPVQLAHEINLDARHTLRLWCRRPMHTVFAIAVLTIAIGANTGLFSVLNALLLRSLPFQHPERLAYMRGHLPGGPQGLAEFHAWRKNSAYAADATSLTSNEVNLEGTSQATRVRLSETSWNFFEVLGVRPVRGRGFAEGEDKPGAATAVIGHGLWQQIYGGDASAIGATVRLNGVALTIVGIAPAGFDYPRGTTVWSSSVFDFQRIPKTTVTFWFAVARLKDNVTWAQARQTFESEVFAARPERATETGVNRPALISLREDLAGPVQQASLVLMAGAALLLILACANLANFLLGHTLAREQELLIRTALGASRARLTQQLLTETILLSLVAAAAGLAVAWWTTSAAAAFQPAQLVSQAYSMLDGQVLAFAMLLSIATGLLFGAGPVLYVTRRLFSLSSRSASPVPRQLRLQHGLVVVQIVVTIVLVTASAALGRTFVGLLRIDNGFALQSVATMKVSFAGTPYMGPQSRVYVEQARQRLEQIPQVTSISATQFLPLATEAYSGGGFNVDGAGAEVLVTMIPVAPDYFATLGGEVLAGREFRAQDMEGTDQIAVVNDAFARSFGGAGSIVGRTLTNPRLEPRQIVGVVRGMRDSGPLHPPHPQVFMPARAARALTFVVKVSGPAKTHIAAIRDALASVDPRVPVFDVSTMNERLTKTLARPRFYATAVVFFGGLGLLLSVVGVYGVVSSACGERIRELGIRLALGTTPGRLRGRLLGRTALLVAIGAVAGSIAGLFVGHQLHALIPGAEQSLAGTIGLAIFGTLVVAMIATWAATHRVASLDIMAALRPE